jgi:O-antigen/teichoic acid export membrane protein
LNSSKAHILKKNIAWSLIGNLPPLFVGIWLMPIIIQSYGLERFGLLAIAWAIVGYFGLFDMGLSRALTQFISQRLPLDNQQKIISEMIYTALRTMWMLGLIAAIVMGCSIPLLVKYVFNVSPEIYAETEQSFLILALCVPFVLHATGIKGVMDALNLFKQSSIIRMVFGSGMFIAPFIASFFGANLVNAMISLVILRIIVWIMHYVAIRKKDLTLHGPVFKTQWLKSLFGFGGWIAVSNIIGPLMVYLDRFLIAHLLGASAVAYYVAPYEIVTKMWVISAGFTTVLFPLFAREWLLNPEYSAQILNKALRYVLMLLTPAVILMAYLAQSWLGIWIGHDFAIKSASIAVWLISGVLINSLAQVLYVYVQGAGRSDLTAKLHLAEALPYWLLLWYLIKNLGLQGAAIAWFLRCAVDCIGLAYLTVRIKTINSSYILNPILWSIGLVSALIMSLLIDNNNVLKFVLISLLLVTTYLIIVMLKKDNIFVLINQFFLKDK